MNIEFRFLQKAIEDRNFVNFTYEGKSYKNIKALKIDDENRIHCDKGVFEFGKIRKLIVLKERFS